MYFNVSKNMTPQVLTLWRPNRPKQARLSILLCLTPDDFTRQWGTRGSQWVKLLSWQKTIRSNHSDDNSDDDDDDNDNDDYDGQAVQLFLIFKWWCDWRRLHYRFLIGHSLEVSCFGTIPRENKNNAYTKFGGQTKSIMVFSEVAHCTQTLATFPGAQNCEGYVYTH